MVDEPGGLAVGWALQLYASADTGAQGKIGQAV